jgi:hypothetical protein
MRIEQLPGLDSEQITQLQAAGIGNCRQLLRVRLHQDRLHGLVQSTGLSLDMLCRLVQRAELSQIMGIGPTTLAHLSSVGVNTLEELAVHDPQSLHSQLERVTGRPPNLAVTEYWILQAQRQQARRGEAFSQACGSVRPSVTNRSSDVT